MGREDSQGAHQENTLGGGLSGSVWSRRRVCERDRTEVTKGGEGGETASAIREGLEFVLPFPL